MRTFEIYCREKAPKYRAVKRGFSWPGFIFTVTWLFAKRMYLYGLILSIVLAPVAMIERIADPEQGNDYLIVSLVYLTMWVIFGFFGNPIWRNHLRRKGYIKVAVYESESASKAILHHILQKPNSEL